jgi:hypothetical protein
MNTTELNTDPLTTEEETHVLPYRQSYVLDLLGKIENLQRCNDRQRQIIEAIRELDPELVRRVQDGEV